MPNARKIADYLRKNPQFLVEHPDLLAELQLPQPADSAESDSDSPRSPSTSVFANAK